MSDQQIIDALNAIVSSMTIRSRLLCGLSLEQTEVVEEIARQEVNAAFELGRMSGRVAELENA